MRALAENKSTALKELRLTNQVRELAGQVGESNVVITFQNLYFLASK